MEVQFQLSGANSLLAAPYVEALAMPMTAQDPGGISLTTTYSGTITVDIDDLMNPTSISFISASATATNSGDWLPQEGGGDAGDPFVFGDANPGTPMPANYGFVLDLGPETLVFYGASRDTMLSLEAASRSVTGGQFDPIDIGISVTEGWFDGNISSQVFTDFEDGSRQDITGLTGANCSDHLSPGSNSCGSSMGSYSVSGNTATLMLPLSFHIGGGTPVVQFTGTFIATALLGDPVPGDYNDDGAVDAADYTVWRDTQGQTGPGLAADGDGDMDVDENDYTLWAQNFGTTTFGSGASIQAVPEPGAFAVAMVVLICGFACGKRLSVVP